MEEGCQAGVGGAPCGNVGDVADGFRGWCSTERAWRWLRRWWAKGEQTIDDGQCSLPAFGIGRRDAAADGVVLALIDHHGIKEFSIPIGNVEL